MEVAIKYHVTWISKANLRTSCKRSLSRKLRFAEILSNIHLLMLRTTHSQKTWTTPDKWSNFIELAFQRFFKSVSQISHVETSGIISWALRISATCRHYTAGLRLKHMNARTRWEWTLVDKLSPPTCSANALVFALRTVGSLIPNRTECVHECILAPYHVKKTFEYGFVCFVKHLLARRDSMWV